MNVKHTDSVVLPHLLHVRAVLHDLDKGWDGNISQRVVTQIELLQSLTGFDGSTQVPDTGVCQRSHFNTTREEEAHRFACSAHLQCGDEKGNI